MQSKGIFWYLVWVKVWLSEGLSMETVMIQWGYWRVVCRGGCELGKGRSHMLLCPPGSRAGRDKSGACVWGAWAPHRWAHETLCCPPSRGWGVEGETRGHPCHQSPRVELGPTVPGSARLTGGTWGQGHIKGIECPPSSAWEGGDWVKGERLRGITTGRCGAT